VTFYENRPVEHILFWVSDESKDYVATKPIHESQTQIKGEAEQDLRRHYPDIEGGVFFTIDCIKNYELIRELCSYGKDLLVLSPDRIREAVINRFSSILVAYNSFLK